MSRVTADDLDWLAEWIDAYECEPDGGRGHARKLRVLAWVENEVARRDKDAGVRAAAKQLGVPVAAVRAIAKAKGGAPSAAPNQSKTET